MQPGLASGFEQMHNRSVSNEQPGRWDGPWCRVRTEHFEVAFLPSDGEDLEAVDNVDVFVDLNDGTRWSGTVFTLGQVEAIMARGAVSGRSLGAVTSGARMGSSSAMRASAR